MYTVVCVKLQCVWDVRASLLTWLPGLRPGATPRISLHMHSIHAAICSNKQLTVIEVSSGPGTRPQIVL